MAYDVPGALNWSPLIQGTNALANGFNEQRNYELRSREQNIREQQAANQQTAFNQQQQDRKMQIAAGLAQSFLNEKDPNKRSAMMTQVHAIDPEFSSDIGKMGFDVNNVEQWAPTVIARARGYQDPMADKVKTAQIANLEAEAIKNKAEGAYYGNKANWPNGGQQPPAGYRWSTTNRGEQEAIPGGPASKLPTDTAARIGMMRASMADLPEVRDIFLGKLNPKTGKRGDPADSGIIGGIEYAANARDIGQGKRLIRGGVESLLRAASGAAVPETEVDRYEGLFMPRYTDSAETRARKLDSFERWMSQIQLSVESGRPIDLVEARKLAEGANAGRETTDASGALPPGNYDYDPATGSIKRK